MNTGHLPAAIGAVLSALLFPIYWYFELGQAIETEQFRTGLSALDVLYLVVGGLSAYVYYGLKAFLNDRCGHDKADTLLLVCVAYTLVSHAGLVALSAVGAAEEMYGLVWISSLVAFGALDVLLGILLIRARSDVPRGIRLFAAMNIVLGVLELTVVLALGAVVLYPLSVLILAFTYLQKPQELHLI